MRTYESINANLMELFAPLVPPETRLEHKIAVAQQNLIVRTAPLSAIITTANAILIVSTLWPYISAPVLIVWLIFMLCFAGLSASLWYRMRHLPLPEQASGAFLRKMELMAAIMGAAWGALKFGLEAGSVELDMFFMLVVAGTAAGFGSLASQIPRMVAKFTVFSILPILVATLLHGSAFGPAILVLGIAFCASLIKGSLHSFSQLRELIRSNIDARRAQEELLNAVESINDAFAMYGADGKPRLVNSRFREWFPDGWHARLDDHGMEQRVTGGRWVMHSVSNREAGGWVSVHTDISSLKNRERELETARREAEDASAAKGRFLSTMSHELRTPLNIINGFSKLMTRDSQIELDDKIVREYADSIHQAGDHLLTVINDIIEFSKAGADSQAYDPQPVAPRELLASAVTLALAFNKMTSMDGLKVSISPAIGEMVVDEMAIRRVLINLISNAIRYGGDPLEVTIRAYLREDGAPVFSVRDNGTGLSPVEVERVFSPFYQCERHRGGDFAGTGLGLTISRELAKLHEGEVLIRSTPGKGTTAALVLPPKAHVKSYLDSEAAAVSQAPIDESTKLIAAE